MSQLKTKGIENNAVTNGKLAQVATQTFKGRTTAGSGNVEDLTTTQATAMLNEFPGDSGSGSIKGLVPAAAAGDAAANKFLHADGTWQNPGTPADDILETTFSLTNSQTNANITGLVFSNAVVRSAVVQYSIVIDDATDYYEEGELRLVQRGSDWTISRSFSGDDSLIDFEITNLGQVQYTSPAYSTFVSGTMKFRAMVTHV